MQGCKPGGLFLAAEGGADGAKDGSRVQRLT